VKSTILVKVQAQDCDGSYPGTRAPTIAVVRLSGNTPAAIEEPVSTSTADTGNVLRFDPTSNHYNYNLSISRLSQDWSYPGFVDGAALVVEDTSFPS
jgi:hypothetical protein